MDAILEFKGDKTTTACLLSIVAVVGISLNVILLVVVVTKRHCVEPYQVYLGTLSVAGLIHSAVGVPLFAVGQTTDTLSPTVCKLCFLSYIGPATCYILLICLMSLCLYINKLVPKYQGKLLGGKLLLIIISCIIIYAFIIMMIHIFAELTTEKKTKDQVALMAFLLSQMNGTATSQKFLECFYTQTGPGETWIVLLCVTYLPCLIVTICLLVRLLCYLGSRPTKVISVEGASTDTGGSSGDLQQVILMLIAVLYMTLVWAGFTVANVRDLKIFGTRDIFETGSLSSDYYQAFQGLNHLTPSVLALLLGLLRPEVRCLICRKSG